jgi:hypothetical protein
MTEEKKATTGVAVGDADDDKGSAGEECPKARVPPPKKKGSGHGRQQGVDQRRMPRARVPPPEKKGPGRRRRRGCGRRREGPVFTDVGDDAVDGARVPPLKKRGLHRGWRQGHGGRI